MPLLPITLLSSIVAATPTVPTPWFGMDDYPVRAFQRRQEGSTAFEVVVTPDGRPASCNIVKSSGSDILDARACAVTKNRIRFSPATDDHGQAAYGMYRSQVNWALDPEKWSQSELGPDLMVSLSKLPAGASGPVSMKYALTIDASGKPTACETLSALHSATLGPLGCSKLMADMKVPPARSESGAAVPSVRTAWITFTQ
ncbi:MAG TPA: energy transducer TonB [Sphingomicrobium sp.]|nr:energy transducer TonB [Sphingomicrobium sp.]